MANFVFYDLETDSSNVSYGQIIQVAAVLVNDDFQELMKKYKIVICGPNTLSAYLQSLHMGFQSLKVQKGAVEIYNHLKTISTRFSKHFDNVVILRKKLEEAMTVVDKFGTDARSISRTLENIKDPEQVENAIKEDVDKIKILNK